MRKCVKKGLLDVAKGQSAWTVIVDASDANTGVAVEVSSRGKRRIVVSECAGGCWYERKVLTAPVSREDATALVLAHAYCAAGITQDRFVLEATR